MVDWTSYRANTAAMLLQGMIETESTWFKRIIDQTVDYKQMARHAVKLTDSLIEELILTEHD